MTRTQAAAPLRRRMLDDMRLRNMADGTRRSYVRSVATGLGRQVIPAKRGPRLTGWL